MNFNPPLNIEPPQARDDTGEGPEKLRVSHRRWLGGLAGFGVALALTTALALRAHGATMRNIER